MTNADRTKARRIANQLGKPMALYTTPDDLEPKIICMCLLDTFNHEFMELIETVWPLENTDD